jgi:ferredoxin
VSAEVTIDRFVCIGSGSCVRLAPGAFELDDEGVAVLLEPLEAELDALRQAERSCPTAAIEVHEVRDDGGDAG